jgi:hypothetical protein
VLCESKRQVKLALRHVVNDEGEGIIIRKPASPYIHGITEDLIKLKVRKGKEKERKNRERERRKERKEKEGEQEASEAGAAPCRKRQRRRNHSLKTRFSLHPWQNRGPDQTEGGREWKGKGGTIGKGK